MNTIEQVKKYCERAGNKEDNKSIQLVPPLVRTFLDGRKAKQGDVSLWVTLKNYLKEEFFEELKDWLDYEKIDLYPEIKLNPVEEDGDKSEIQEVQKTEVQEQEKDLEISSD